jgi:hypothetical protein
LFSRQLRMIPEFIGSGPLGQGLHALACGVFLGPDSPVVNLNSLAHILSKSRPAINDSLMKLGFVGSRADADIERLCREELAESSDHACRRSSGGCGRRRAPSGPCRHHRDSRVREAPCLSCTLVLRHWPLQWWRPRRRWRHCLGDQPLRAGLCGAMNRYSTPCRCSTSQAVATDGGAHG